MKKLHDIIYHFAGTKNSCETMICNKCKSKIDSLTQDWCHGIKYKANDWSFVTFHRSCFVSQGGWIKLELKEKQFTEKVENIKNMLLQFKENGVFIPEVYQALDELNLSV